MSCLGNERTRDDKILGRLMPAKYCLPFSQIDRLPGSCQDPTRGDQPSLHGIPFKAALRFLS